MKTTLLIISVLMTSIAAQAQSPDNTTSTKSKTYYSFAWGLFKSKDYPRDKTVVVEFEKPDISTSLSISPVDSTLYVEKSILWGAIQWTEKKKPTPPERID